MRGSGDEKVSKRHFIFFLLLASWLLDAGPVGAVSLQLIQSIPLPGVVGRIDHLAIDLKYQRLFIAALGNNSLEIVDLKSGKWIRRIPGLHEPQGVFFVPEFNRIFISNGQGGTLDVFDGTTLKVIQSVSIGPDADNIRYDHKQNLVYVGYGNGGLGSIDPKDGKIVGNIPLEAHPEAFELESSGVRIFVNVPRAKEVAVVDGSQGRTIAKWQIPSELENFPMSLDESHHRLFIGTRRPPKLVVIDTDSGKRVASLECVGDVDDIFYDGRQSRIYASGGEGFLQTFDQTDADHYASSLKIATASGARTSLFVPELNRLFVAVPHRGGQEAMVNVYAPQP